jgi:hypothetical protein
MFGIGLVVFSLAAHQRARLAMPLMPVGALMAGRELARWTSRFETRKVLAASAALAITALTLLGLHRHFVNPRRSGVRDTEGLRELASLIEQRLGPAYPLVHLASPFGLQHFLKTTPPPATAAHVAEVWSSELPLIIAVDTPARLRGNLPPGSPPMHELARWPATGKYSAALLSNRPALEPSERQLWLFDSLIVRTERSKILGISGSSFELEPSSSGANIELQVFNDLVAGMVSLAIDSHAQQERVALRAGESHSHALKGRTTVTVRTDRPTQHPPFSKSRLPEKPKGPLAPEGSP